MGKKTTLNAETADRLLTTMLMFARMVDHILEIRAVGMAVDQPLSASKVQVLRLLSQRTGQTSSQIARFLGVSKPAVSQIIDSMVRARLVTRKTAKNDRREVNLQLTSKGKALCTAIRREQRQYLRAALNRAGQADPEQWVDMMQTISEALAQADRQFDRFCVECGAQSDGTCLLDGGEAQCHFLAYRSRTTRSPRKRISRR